jgi:hypothetical protein
MAVTSSFKQQCPSCEALVPIRDPKLVGRKIDCPKCKYRFVVEAPADEAAEEEAPAEKAAAKAPAKAAAAAATKGTSNGVTKKPTKPKAPAEEEAEAPPPPEDNGADDTEDSEAAAGDTAKPKKKKKKKKEAGVSNTLKIGIAVAVVAVIALGVTAYFVFFRKGDSPSSTPAPAQVASNQGGPGRQGGGPPGMPGMPAMGGMQGGPAARGGPPGAANPGAPNAGGPNAAPGPGNPPPKGADAAAKDKPKDEAKEAPPPEDPDADITNLLPNDTQAIVSLPINRLGASAFKQALSAQGGFNADSFKRTFGLSIFDVTKILMALNPGEDWVFTVMRTDKPIQLDTLKASLKLAPQKQNGFDYYLIRGQLDSLSMLLLKGNQTRENFTLHVMDSKTLVFADPAPMKKFLDLKRHVPNHPTQPVKETPAEKQPAAPGAGGQTGAPPGAPGAGMQGGMAGMAGGPPRQPMSAGMGGGPPPGGVPSSPAPGGKAGAGQPEPKAAKPAVVPYRTISADLKAVLEQVEKSTPTDPPVLLSTAMETPLWLESRFVKALQEQIQNRLFGLGMAPAGAVASKLRVIGFSIRLTEAKAAVALAGLHDEAQAQDLAREIHAALPILFESLGLDLLEDTTKNRQAQTNPAPGNVPGGANLPMGGPRRLGGGPGGGEGGAGRPGGMGGGNFIPPNMPNPGGPGGGGNFIPPNMPNPGGPGVIPGAPPGVPGGPGFVPPGGAPGGRPGGNDANTKGKDGNWAAWSANNMLTCTLNLTLKDSQYKAIGQAIEDVMVGFRGIAELAHSRPRMFDLAAAVQAYVKKNGHFPRGTIPRRADPSRVLDWRPDQRLSWMVELLEYLGAGEYADLRFDPEKSWTEEPNRLRARIPIPYYLGQLHSRDSSAYLVRYPGAGNFAASHWVGISGVGYDAAYYRLDDPAVAEKVGMFGYERMIKPEDVKDGLANTIALIQVPPNQAGPWMAGGGSTVRGVSEQPDCVHAFVCTKYKDQPGTFAIMGDGKVRFIPANMPPEQFRALCTIAGKEKVRDLDKIAPVVEPEEPANDQKAEALPPVPPDRPPPPGKGGDAAKVDPKPPPR